MYVLPTNTQQYVVCFWTFGSFKTLEISSRILDIFCGAVKRHDLALRCDVLFAVKRGPDLINCGLCSLRFTLAPFWQEKFDKTLFLISKQPFIDEELSASKRVTKWVWFTFFENHHDVCSNFDDTNRPVLAPYYSYVFIRTVVAVVKLKIWGKGP